MKKRRSWRGFRVEPRQGFRDTDEPGGCTGPWFEDPLKLAGTRGAAKRQKAPIRAPGKAGSLGALQMHGLQDFQSSGGIAEAGHSARGERGEPGAVGMKAGVAKGSIVGPCGRKAASIPGIPDVGDALAVRAEEQPPIV